ENDWSRAGQFNLMTARIAYTRSDLDKAYQALRSHWFQTTDQLVRTTGFDRAAIHGLMSEHAREGNVIYDLNKGVYRARELSKEGIPLEAFRHGSEVEQEAFVLELGGNVRLTSRAQLDHGETVAGQVTDQGQDHQVLLRINEDKQLTDANCTCAKYKADGLRLGPCRHMLALRMHVGV
ncbi:MAG: SWIM zinc finger family protein, partial [Bacteroidota bacterium]